MHGTQANLLTNAWSAWDEQPYLDECILEQLHGHIRTVVNLAGKQNALARHVRPLVQAHVAAHRAANVTDAYAMIDVRLKRALAGETQQQQAGISDFPFTCTNHDQHTNTHNLRS